MPPELTSRPDLLEPGWLTTVLIGPAAIAAIIAAVPDAMAMSITHMTVSLTNPPIR